MDENGLEHHRPRDWSYAEFADVHSSTWERERATKRLRHLHRRGCEKLYPRKSLIIRLGAHCVDRDIAGGGSRTAVSDDKL